MPGLIPSSGSEVAMGKVYTAYTNASYPTTPGTGVSLSAILGANYGGVPAGSQISLSSTFGGESTPYDYPE